METAEAFRLMSAAIDSGRANRGFLVCGDVPGSAEEFTRLVAEKLFGRAEGHPDMCVVEPTGATRTVKVKSVKETLIRSMEVTSYSDGWKLGVVKGADRLTTEAANAFLKNLEEPTPMTMYLLLTDNPEECLPTIVSRCQRLDLPRCNGCLDSDRHARVEELLTPPYPVGVAERDVLAQKLADLLSDMKAECGENEGANVKKRFFASVDAIMREWMVGGELEPFRAYRNIEAVQEAFVRGERSMGDETVISLMIDKISFPAG